MEPIGFAASLITVVGLVTASSKKIHDLRGKLRNAPKDAENILEQVHTYANLLDELKTQLQDHRNSVAPQETLQQVWESSIAQMQQDVQSLQAVLSKYESLLKKKSRSSKILLLARYMLSEREVEQYQRKLDIHCGTLTNIQAMVCSRKLGKVSESISELGEEDRAGFRTLSSQLSQTASHLNSEAKAGFSAVSSQHNFTESMNKARHQAVLAHLDDHAKRDDVVSEKMDEIFERHVRSMDMNEAGFQTVHSSLVAASSSSKEDHKKTHAMLSQFQGQWQQVLRNHVTFGTVGSGVRSSTPGARASNLIAKTTVFWERSVYRMPIGMLIVRLTKSRQSKDSSRSTLQVCTTSDIVIDFVPPRWLSRVVINYSMKRNYDLISDQWRWGATLRPLTVNYNQFFIKAVKSLDVEGVRRSFAEGLARPTDYVLKFSRLVPWYFHLGGTIPDIPHRFAKYYLMADYMVENGLPGQVMVIRNLAHVLKRGDTDAQVLLRNQAHKYSKHGGKLLAAGSKIFDVIFMFHQIGRIDWIPDYLQNPSEPWLVDELSSSQICLIGTLARADAVFSDRLREQLASYRSPASANRPSFADHLFETTFSAASIEHHFRELEYDDKYALMSLLCRTGSTTMLQPFIDTGVDVNGDRSDHNMLGYAAAEGNMDIVYMLLENGANTQLAIATFLYRSEDLSDTLFRRLIELLVENARPALFNGYNDPLLAIIKSSRAQCSYPKAAEILLDRKVFDKKYFGDKASKTLCDYSYMYQAIVHGRSSMVDLLLQNGARADAHISHLFDCYDKWIKVCTWITFSVMHGVASCTDVLIQHGADVTALDGAGRSALQLAWDHALGSHPREIEWYHCFQGRCFVTAEEDAETLAVAVRAFNLKFQDTESLDYYLNLSNEVAPQPPSRRNRLMSQLEKMLGKALGVILTPSQIELLHLHFRKLKYDIQKVWSLSFHEALLMRCLYVISYTFLLAYELNALIKGRKRITIPSRFLLSTLAFLALALIWGSSREGLSWGASTAGTKA